MSSNQHLTLDNLRFLPPNVLLGECGGGPQIYAPKGH